MRAELCGCSLWLCLPLQPVQSRYSHLPHDACFGFLLLLQVHGVLFSRHTGLLVNGIYFHLDHSFSLLHSLALVNSFSSSFLINCHFLRAASPDPKSGSGPLSYSLKNTLYFSFLGLISVCIYCLFVIIFQKPSDSK